MRLIDADKLLEQMKGMNMLFSPKIVIDNMPTAYDIDKVVEELEETKTINVDVGFGTIYKTIRKDVAIEIVKRGGKSE